MELTGSMEITPDLDHMESLMEVVTPMEIIPDLGHMETLMEVVFPMETHRKFTAGELHRNRTTWTSRRSDQQGNDLKNIVPRLDSVPCWSMEAVTTPPTT